MALTLNQTPATGDMLPCGGFCIESITPTAESLEQAVCTPISFVEINSPAPQKSGFDFSAVSSSSMIVNANRLQLHGLAYNLFNWFRRLALPPSMRKQQIDTIRLKLLKIAARAVRKARYLIFKLCSSCPYTNEFYETLYNIGSLRPLLI